MRANRIRKYKLVSKHDLVFRLKMLKFRMQDVTPVRLQMLLGKLRRTTMSTFGVSMINPCTANDTACGPPCYSVCQFSKCHQSMQLELIIIQRWAVIKTFRWCVVLSPAQATDSRASTNWSQHHNWLLQRLALVQPIESQSKSQLCEKEQERMCATDANQE